MQNSDSTHTIMKSAKRFFSGTMLSRVTGMFRDIAMAYAFGTQEAVAAFLVAFRLAHLLRRLFGEGALQSAFIPQFEALRSEHPQRACRFFLDLFVWLSIGLTAIIIITMSVLWAVWAYVDLAPGNSEILFLTILLMPSLLFICLFGLNASLLQCEKSYFIPGAAPIAFNLIWILGVVVLWKHSASLAMPWMTGWIILACLFQWLITVPSVYRTLKSNGISVWKGFYENFATTDVKNLAKPLLLAIIGVGATQVNNALDALFARYADAEGPALLWYALRIQQLPLALFGIAISGALLPPLTRALKSHDIIRYQMFLEFALRRSLALMLPITAAILIMGETCVALLYGHGDFGAGSVGGTTYCLWGYGVGLIPMSLVLILAPAFYAQGNIATPTKASVASMLLNIVLNAAMVMGLGLGATSIAIATSISAWVNLAMLGYSLTHSRQIISLTFMVSAGKVLIASIAASVAVFFVNVHFFEGFFGQLSRFVIQASSFTTVLLGVAFVLNATDLLGLVGLGRKETYTVPNKS